MKRARRFWSPATSRPPSVVRSSRRSGTMQAAWGPWASAMPCISSVAAISKFSGMVIASMIAAISASRMWRRSSRRCAVIPSAPAASAILAARTGSGKDPPRAFLSVATWSIFTPSLSLSVISVSVLPSLSPGRQSTAPACRRSLSIFLRNREERRFW
jgi:hypothetical protein